MKTAKNKKWLKVVQIGVGLVIVLLIIFQCKKDVAIPFQLNTSHSNPHNTYLPLDSLIIGKWKWVYSITSWSQNTLTPLNAGFNYYLKFKKDTVYLLKNNSIDGIMTYSIGYKKFSTNSPTTYDSLPCLNRTVLVFPTTTHIIGDVIIKLNQDTLLFDDRWIDGDKILYQREK
jgi:hypothetical protein